MVNLHEGGGGVTAHEADRFARKRTDQHATHHLAPVIPFIVVGGFIITAQRIKTRENSEQATLDAETSEANAPQAETTEDLIEQMRVHALEILLAPN